MPELPIDLKRFDWEWKNGTRTRARQLAKEHILENYQHYAAQLRGKSIDELVQMVDGYREAGDEQGRIIVDMWIVGDFAHAEPPPAYIDAPHFESIADELSLQRMEHLGKVLRQDEKRAVAKEYVDANRDWLSPVLDKLTEQELVRLVDIRRDEGLPMEALAVEAWVLTHYEPRRVVGQMHVGITAKAIEAALNRKRRFQSG